MKARKIVAVCMLFLLVFGASGVCGATDKNDLAGIDSQEVAAFVQTVQYLASAAAIPASGWNVRPDITYQANGWTVTTSDRLYYTWYNAYILQYAEVEYAWSQIPNQESCGEPYTPPDITKSWEGRFFSYIPAFFAYQPDKQKLTFRRLGLDGQVVFLACVRGINLDSYSGPEYKDALRQYMQSYGLLVGDIVWKFNTDELFAGEVLGFAPTTQAETEAVNARARSLMAVSETRERLAREALERLPQALRGKIDFNKVLAVIK